MTREVVSASQRLAGRKSEITIRPEVQPSATGAPGQLAADDIYISLRDPSQTGALRQALAEIARRHKLTVAETSTSGMVRFDFSSGGNRTHSIHVVTPLAAGARAPLARAPGNPELAIIIDDMGHDRSAADSLLALSFPVTISVLPHLPLSTEVAEDAFRRGDQILLHLPMEPESEGALAEGARTEEIELRVGMNRADVASMLEGMLETVPHAAGVNNHEGSRATADPALMQELMPALRERGLFFIDSRTTAATVAYDAAERAGVRAASRKVFLDDRPVREAVAAQLELAARDALRDGSAIAIGHPHPETIAALADGIPRLEARGIRLVFASDLAH
ncbi:MAG TPA: divergent polysaccharide deacetylase family protein [Candidatus Acidoferrales bacterium]|nr:divergent polysaccharide deacetylase family protein [Candidatus Acidoferrales bacterium]